MEYKVVGKSKESVEVELNDKTMAGLIASELDGMGVDAAYYEPHPLFPAVRIKINSGDGEKDLKAALSSLEKKVAELKKSLL